MTTSPSHRQARQALTKLLEAGLDPTPQNFALYFGQEQEGTEEGGLLYETLETLIGTFLEHPILCETLDNLRSAAKKLEQGLTPFRQNLAKIRQGKRDWLSKLVLHRRALREELRTLETCQERQHLLLSRSTRVAKVHQMKAQAFGARLPAELQQAWAALEAERLQLSEELQALELGHRESLTSAMRIGVLFDVLEQNLPSGETVADIDPLTQTLNRRGFFRKLRQVPEPTGALLALDLDHFRSINEKFGHPGGDKALQFVAEIVRSLCRDEDILARFGGEEFMVYLPACDAHAAYKRAETIRMNLATSSLKLVGGDRIPLTGSLGVTLWDNADEEFEAAYSRVDAALYAAKNAGRNRVITSWDAY